MNTFISLIGTGIPGFLSYWYLSKHGLMDFNKDRKDEKIVALTALSAINIFFTWILSTLLYQRFGIELSIASMDGSQMLVVFIIGAVISLLLTVFVYPYIISKAISGVDGQLKNSGKPFIINRHILKDIIYSNKKDFVSVYIFNNNENRSFVESGYLEALGEIDGNLQLMLSGRTFSVKEKFSYEEVAEIFNSDRYDKEDKHIYFDANQKIIMFIFFIRKNET